MVVHARLPVGVHEVSKCLNVVTRRLVLIDFKVSDQVVYIVGKEVPALSIFTIYTADFSNIIGVAEVDENDAVSDLVGSGTTAMV